MTRKTLLTLSVSATLAIISFAPTAVFAQFPPPPPMGLGGPPPIAAGGPPAFGGPPPMGPGGAPRAGFGGPAPRLGAGAGPRGDLRALGGVRAVGRDGPAVARSIQARSARLATAVPEASAMAMTGGDMVTVQPTPLEPMPAMPLAVRTMAIIPTATATTSTSGTDAFCFATSDYGLRRTRGCRRGRKQHFGVRLFQSRDLCTPTV